jgi:hypothetical protein
MMFKDNEPKPTLFGEAEKRGHKTEKSKRSFATKVRTLFSKARAKGATRKTKKKKIIEKRRRRRR